ncbi:hypothetical protein AMTR_s00149p00020040 [Amborella trichopoda]|uniref:Uncharacterized protein n=1 Tax=Amborella trichopoda TaxID=13333 RepID=W1PN79_AMBTC|nr:hypothetical protein AMTR_s00149p00020040 [Amborella trichopoda]
MARRHPPPPPPPPPCWEQINGLYPKTFPLLSRPHPPSSIGPSPPFKGPEPPGESLEATFSQVVASASPTPALISSSLTIDRDAMM